MGKSISWQVGDTIPLDKIPFQSWRKVHREENVLGARILAQHQKTAARCTKKSLFLPKNFKLSCYPTASLGAGAAESAPALLSHQGHLSR